MTKPALWLSLPSAKLHQKKIKTRQIKRRTPKRASEEAKYRRRVKVWIEGKYCRVAWYARMSLEPATQCHHTHGKRGKLLLYEPWWCPVSQWGHDWIRDNPIEARKLGLLCDVGQWNVPPKAG